RRSPRARARSTPAARSNRRARARHYERLGSIKPLSYAAKPLTAVLAAAFVLFAVVAEAIASRCTCRAEACTSPLLLPALARGLRLARAGACAALQPSSWPLALPWRAPRRL